MADLRAISTAKEGDAASLMHRFDELWIKLLRAYLSRSDLEDEPPVQVLTSQSNLARLLAIYGPPDEARLWYSREVKLGHRIRNGGKVAPPESVVLARHLVNGHIGLALGFAQEGKLDTAIEIWRAGGEIARAEHARFPKDFQLWHARYRAPGQPFLRPQGAGARQRS